MSDLWIQFDNSYYSSNHIAHFSTQDQLLVFYTTEGTRVEILYDTAKEAETACQKLLGLRRVYRLK